MTTDTTPESTSLTEELVGHTPGPWSYSGQEGAPKRCFQAQVWDSEGNSLACIEPTNDAAEATATARLMALAPTLLAENASLRSQLEEARKGLEFVESWVANPASSYSVAALDGLFGMTRDRIATLSLLKESGNV